MFEKEDMRRFAESSHDFNPLHLDEAFAKTTIYGENVVFGMLGVAHALETFDFYPEELKARFASPMFLGRVYTCESCEKNRGRQILLKENGSTVLEISGGGVLKPLKPIKDQGLEVRRVAYSDEPLDEVDRFIDGDYIISGEYLPDPQDCQAQIVNAKLCSYIIGMIMPGRNSLFMEAVMQVKRARFRGEKLEYRIGKKYSNSGMGLLKLIVEVYEGGELAAVDYLMAYVRAAFSPSAALPEHGGEDLRGKVVLVIGGTKGVGAELVKKYAVQGANVIATYFHDGAKAEALERVLSGAGGTVEFVQCDASDGAVCRELYARIRAEYQAVDTLYLCAALAPHNIPLYFETYPAFEAYLDRSMRLFYYPLVTFLNLMGEGGAIGVFSSVALLDRRTNHKMIEYICAKSVLENVVESIAFGERRKDLRFRVIRAPKMLTEMNNTPTGRLEAQGPDVVVSRVFSEMESLDKKDCGLMYLDF